MSNFLNYQLITLSVSKEEYELVVDFYLKLKFSIFFEDTSIHTTEFKIVDGMYLRIIGEDKSLENSGVGNSVKITLSVPNINDSYSKFSSIIDSISSINIVSNMESFFEITDPVGFKIRISEFEHGPIEWRESLENYKKQK